MLDMPLDDGKSKAPAIKSTGKWASELRRAQACRVYIATLEAEMDACARLQEERYRQAAILGEEFDTLAERRRNMAAGLHKLELRLQRAGTYWISAEQADTVLAKIAEVGADTRRFCRWLGVEAVPRIPYWQLDEALAALDEKAGRQRVAA